MRKADLSGSGEAWALENPEKKKDGSSHGTIRSWLVRGEWHAFWNYWQVAVVHLRDSPGLEPSHKSSPEMTHEFLIFALYPGEAGAEKREYDPDDLPHPVQYMEPVDVAVQFHCSSDAQAADICDAAVKTIIAGAASPDSDFREYWEMTIPATAACGKHADKGLH